MQHSDFDGCNFVADVLHFLYRVRIWFVCRTFQVSPKNSTVNESNPHTIQELKDNISYALAAIKITILHRVYLNTIRCTQLCIDAGGNHFQHLLWRYVLSAFGCCINFCIYAMLRTQATFSWPILYYIGLLKKMDGIWNRYNLKSTGRIYTFGVLKCSEKFKVLDLP